MIRPMTAPRTNVMFPVAVEPSSSRLRVKAWTARFSRCRQSLTKQWLSLDSRCHPNGVGVPSTGKTRLSVALSQKFGHRYQNRIIELSVMLKVACSLALSVALEGATANLKSGIESVHEMDLLMVPLLPVTVR